MSCRCNDIISCKSDIENVMDMIAIAGEMAAENNQTIIPSLKLTAEETEETMSPQNIDLLCDNILHANENMDKVVSSVQSLCGMGLQKLQTDLKLLELEDEAYHAKEES